MKQRRLPRLATATLSLIILAKILATSTSFSLRPSGSIVSAGSSIIDGKFTSCAPRIKASFTENARVANHIFSLYSSSTNSNNNGATQESSTQENTDENSQSSTSSKRRPTKQFKNLYSILGATPSMSKSEIKRLYITLAKQTHPDSSSYNPLTSQDQFNEIARAYSTLSDDKLRKKYDRELAAEEFKDDVVGYAAEVAKEYGPAARKFYEDWALPIIKKTAGVSVAGFKVVSEVTGEASGGGIKNGRGEGSSRKTTQSTKDGEDALGDFGRAFQRVIEAGRNATRQIDGEDLQIKSQELRMRCVVYCAVDCLIRHCMCVCLYSFKPLLVFVSITEPTMREKNH
jgi:curved DNA-binding protein CbpA